jgi:aryl-alcohol dehydrogenase-like predicted oxidoreductase
MERREFLKGVAVLGIASSLRENSMAQASHQDMPYRELGRAGERVSALGMGGFHIGHPQLSEADSVRLIRSAVDRGINFMDNSWDYNEGQSEIRMGKALKDGYRQKVFLMTKLDGRTKTPFATAATTAPVAYE